MNAQDAPLLYSWMQEKFFYYYKPYFKNIYSNVASIAQRIQTLTSLDSLLEVELLIMQRCSQNPIGLFSLCNIDTINRKAEISVAFKSGFGTRCIPEALQVVFDYIFSSFKLNKLYFYVTSDNQKILQKMKSAQILQEGKLFKEVLSENGEWIDLYRFCIFHEDWLQNPFFKRLENIYQSIK